MLFVGDVDERDTKGVVKGDFVGESIVSLVFDSKGIVLCPDPGSTPNLVLFGGLPGPRPLP